MKRLLSILIAIALMLSMSVTAFAEELQGDGTENAPYIIESVDELNAFLTKVSASGGTMVYAKLGADISLGSAGVNFGGSVHLDLSGYTLSAGTFNFRSGTAQLLNGTMNGRIRPIEDTSVYMEGVHLVYDSSYPLYGYAGETSSGSIRTLINLENCRIEYSAYFMVADMVDVEYRFTDCTLVNRDESVRNIHFFPQKSVVYLQGEKLPQNEMAVFESFYKIGAGYDKDWLLDNQTTTTIEYVVAPTFTVSIPATVALGETATIKAENVVVPKGKQVEVTLTNANGFKLATPQGAELGYTVKNGETAVNEGDAVLAVNPANGKTGETTLTFTTPETAQFAGDYTGTVTFTIAVNTAENS